MQDGITQEVAAAGGKVTGQLTITKEYTDPARGQRIITLATGQAHPPGLTLPTVQDPGQIGGALLAYVLLGKGQQTDQLQVLGGLSELHMVSVEGSLNPATNIIVIGHGGLPSKDYGGQAELQLVRWLAQGGGKVVVAGDTASAASHGLVSLVRNSTAEHDTVATVDNADVAFGQVSTILALADAINGQIGHYGTEQGADALFPSPNR